MSEDFNATGEQPNQEMNANDETPATGEGTSEPTGDQAPTEEITAE